MSVFSLNKASAPPAALEIAAGRVSGATLDIRSGGAIVSSYASEALTPAAVVPALNGPNIVERPAVEGALARVFARLGGAPRRVALVVADTVAKVSLVRFEKLPSRAEDLEQLVRYQVRKAAPFHVEDAQVSYTPGATHADGARELIVTLARRDIVSEYESVIAAAGAEPGLVDLATFNVINAVLAARGGASGDWLLVHVTPASASVAIMRGSDMIFFRTRGEEAEGTLADVTHQTAMYYEDRLGGAGFGRVVLVGGQGAEAAQPSGGGPDGLRRTLETRLQTPVDMLDASRLVTFADRIAIDQATADRLAPLIGVVLRGRVAA